MHGPEGSTDPRFGILFKKFRFLQNNSFLLTQHSQSEVAQSCLTLYDPMDYIACQVPPSMGFSRQEYWSGLPFPSPGDLTDPGIKPGSPALQADSLPSELPGNPTTHNLIQTQPASKVFH